MSHNAIADSPEGRHYTHEFERFVDAAKLDDETLSDFIAACRDDFVDFCKDNCAIVDSFVALKNEEFLEFCRRRFEGRR